MKDRKIVLPESLGPFTIPGEPENGKQVWYSIELWGLKYSVSGNYSPRIRGAAAVRKYRQWLCTTPNWLPNHFARWQVWKFSDDCLNLRGSSDYQAYLASEALKHGVVLDERFFAEVCREAEKAIDGLWGQVSDADNPRPRLARAA